MPLPQAASTSGVLSVARGGMQHAGEPGGWQAVADSLGAREAGKVSGSGLHTTAPSAPFVRLGFAAVCSAVQAKQAVGAVIA